MDASEIVGHAVQVKGDANHRGGIAEYVTRDGWVGVRECPSVQAAVAALAAGLPIPQGGLDEYRPSQLEFDPT